MHELTEPHPPCPASPPAPNSPADVSSADGASVDSTLVRDTVVGDIERFLKEAIVQLEALEPEEASRPSVGRPRVLPSLALWAGMLVCILQGFSSQLAIWRCLSHKQLWFYPRFPVSDQAVYKRLESEGVLPLVRLFCQISLVLRERLAPFIDKSLAPFACEVLALDESTLDKIARMLPSLRGIPKGDKRLLAGKLVGLFDVRRQQWWKVEQIADAHQNEKVACRGVLKGLAKGALILFDLGYFAFPWFDYLSAEGYYFVSRFRLKTSYRVLHVFYQKTISAGAQEAAGALVGEVFDGIVWLGAYRADKAAWAVRLVRFAVGGKERVYITNVLDPNTLSLQEIARLYARRWDFELAINLLKRHLKLHLFWSSKPTIILQQVFAVLIISQVLQALRLEIAGRAEVEVFDVSMALLVEYLPRYAYSGENPIEVFVTEGRALRFIRPSTRKAVVAPKVEPDEIAPLPPDLVLIREPRYAGKQHSYPSTLPGDT
jgi:hypothetical protein